MIEVKESKLKRILLVIINWTWCLPQNLVALILLLFLKTKGISKEKHYGIKATIYNTELKIGSVSLGSHIFLCRKHWDYQKVIFHEWGHCIQSYILGPLYLPVIALPSLIWAGTYKSFKKDYYWFYTEKWANKLVGLE